MIVCRMIRDGKILNVIPAKAGIQVFLASNGSHFLRGAFAETTVFGQGRLSEPCEHHRSIHPIALPAQHEARREVSASGFIAPVRVERWASQRFDDQTFTALHLQLFVSWASVREAPFPLLAQDWKTNLDHRADRRQENIAWRPDTEAPRPHFQAMIDRSALASRKTDCHK